MSNDERWMQNENEIQADDEQHGVGGNSRVVESRRRQGGALFGASDGGGNRAGPPLLLPALRSLRRLRRRLQRRSYRMTLALPASTSSSTPSPERTTCTIHDICTNPGYDGCLGGASPPRRFESTAACTVTITEAEVSCPPAFPCAHLCTGILASPVGPWVSLADTHFDFGRVEQIPVILWRSDKFLVAAPLSASLFVAFFGFAVEARRPYALFGAAASIAFWRALGRVEISRPDTGFFATSSSASASRASGTRTRKHRPRRSTLSSPSYSPSSGSGSFTASFTASELSMDLKRSECHQLAGGGDAEKGVYPHTPPSASSSVFPDSPASPDYVLPLHVAWHARAYPASPAPGHADFTHPGANVDEAGEEDEHDDGEEAQWSPASDTHSIALDALPPHLARGRALV
ncbi:hypothetical protein C8R44DRAFT_887931 [Mycena epipterygia]|nr:hypothetical protein C8R44DRAFT_887931 [Mycena epipterygia]